MSRTRVAILSDLADAVLEMEDERALELVHEALDAGIAPYDVIQSGLVPGMDRAGELFDEGEYFVPELLLCSDVMYEGLSILRPLLVDDSRVDERVGVVIGVVQGDTHDIGKNLVRIMLEVAGFQVYDLGRDVPVARFVDTAIENDARIICLSTLMTTTLDGMAEVVRLLEERGVRDNHHVIVGGGPVTAGFADKIGADAYGESASRAVAVARELAGIGVPA
jgi:corrinoid protein of di/trimethylamine methyltransferase